MTKFGPIATSRLLLRPFKPDDLELFVGFFSNEGFIRFSIGEFTRERVADFVNKVIGWDQAGVPSQFVVTVQQMNTPIGYCGFFHHHVDDWPEIEIGYRLLP